MRIQINIRNLDKVSDFIKSVPYGGVRVAVQAIAEYILGNQNHGLKHDQPYKYASRGKAYGNTGAKFENGNPVPAGYFSAKQFRFVAAITKGFTRLGRKHTPTKASESYALKATKNGYGATITGGAGAYWTRTGQPQQLKDVGWRSLNSVVESNVKGALRHAVAAMNKHFKSKL